MAENPFADLFSYAPLAGAVGLTAMDIYKDVKGQINKPPNAANKIGRMVSDAQRLAADARRKGTIQVKDRLIGAVSGELAGAKGFSFETMNRIGSSWIASIINPNSGLSKEEMQIALGRTSDWLAEVSNRSNKKWSIPNIAGFLHNTIKGMNPNQASVFYKAFQNLALEDEIVGFSNFDYTSSGANQFRRHMKGYTEIAETRWKTRGSSLTRNTARFSIASQSLDWATNLDVSLLQDQKAIGALNRKLFGNRSVTFARPPKFYKINKGGEEFFMMEFQHHNNQKKPFRVTLPGLGKGKAHRGLSPGNFVTFTMGDILDDKNKGLQIWRNYGSIIEDLASGKKTKRDLDNFYMNLYAIAQFEPDTPGQGQALRRTFFSNLRWDRHGRPPAGEKTTYTGKNLREFMERTGNEGLEPYGPGSIAKGGLLETKNFVSTTGQVYDLSKLLVNSSHYSRINRMWQMVRDLAWTPTSDFNRIQVLKEDVAGPMPGDFVSPFVRNKHGGFNPDLLRKVTLGKGLGAIPKFIPINATKEYEKLFIEEHGYISPQAFSLSLTKAGKRSRIPGFLGIGEGEGLRSRAFMSQINTSYVVPYHISALPGTPVPFTLYKNTGMGIHLPIDERSTPRSLSRGGKGKPRTARIRSSISFNRRSFPNASEKLSITDPIEYAKVLNEHIQKYGPIRLAQGQHLGISPTGDFVRAEKSKNITERIVGVTLRPNHTFSFDVEQTVNAEMGTVKVHAGTSGVKATLKGTRMGSVLETFGLSPELVEEAELHGLNWESPASKDLGHAQNQLAASLRWVAKLEHDRIYKQKSPQIEQFERQLHGLNNAIANLEQQLAEANKKLFNNGYIESRDALTINNPMGAKPNRDLDLIRSLLKDKSVAEEYLSFARSEHSLLDAQLQKARSSYLRPKKQALESFLKSDIWAHLGNDPARWGRKVFNTAKRLDLGHELTPFIFGNVLEQLSGQKDKTSRRLRGEIIGWLHAKGGNDWIGINKNNGKSTFFGQATEAFLTLDSHWAGDYPHMQTGRIGSLERRNLDAILSNLDVMGSNKLISGIIGDLYSGIADPTNVKDFAALESMYRSLHMGLDANGLSVVGADPQPLSDITSAAWFKGEGARVQLPEHLHAAFRAAGMSTEINIPGEAMVSQYAGALRPEERDDIGRQISRSGYARIATQELVGQDYRERVKDLFKSLTSSQSPEEIAEFWKQETQDMFGISFDRLFRGKLGPGSSYAQVSSVGDIRDLADFRLVEEGLVKKGDKVVANENTVFISKKLANRLLHQMEEEGIALSDIGLNREAFLSGKQLHTGIIGRMPGISQTSIQPINFAVFQGNRSYNEDLIKVQSRRYMVQDSLTNTKRFMELGLGPGMFLDFDGDRAFIKMFMTGQAIDAATGEAMSAYNRNYRFTQAFQEIVNEHYKENLEAFTNNPAVRQMFGLKDTTGLSPSDRLRVLEDAEKMLIGKDIGKASKGLEELKFALRTDKNVDPNVRSTLLNVFTAIEEPVSLKAKKLPFAFAASQTIVESLYKGGGLNVDAFLSQVDQMLTTGPAGTSALDKGVNISIAGEQRTFKFGSAERDVLRNVVNTYTNQDQGIRRKFFTVARTERQMSPENAVRAWNWMMTQGDIFEGDFVRGISAFEKANSENLISQLNAHTKGIGEAVSRGIEKNQRLLIGGLVGTAVLGSLFTSPYDDNPLDERETSQELLDRIDEGSVLSARNQQVDPGSLNQDPGGPAANPQLTSPTTRVSSTSTSTRIQASGDGDGGLSYASERWRNRMPGGHSKVFIQDQRRPLYPTRFNED